MGEHKENDNMRTTTGVLLVVAAVVFLLSVTDIIDWDYIFVSGKAWAIIITFVLFGAGLVMIYGKG